MAVVVANSEVEPKKSIEPSKPKHRQEYQTKEIENVNKNNTVEPMTADRKSFCDIIGGTFVPQTNETEEDCVQFNTTVEECTKKGGKIGDIMCYEKDSNCINAERFCFIMKHLKQNSLAYLDSLRDWFDIYNARTSDNKDSVIMNEHTAKLKGHKVLNPEKAAVTTIQDDFRPASRLI